MRTNLKLKPIGLLTMDAMFALPIAEASAQNRSGENCFCRLEADATP